ncbi:spermidine synthase [Actinoplanes sp. CA-142083]|uniref:spermidine synthase n=1 Tax=Actinoplanes sp. CA-142083 TaxID=3239903 RepID=UPI003D90B998
MGPHGNRGAPLRALVASGIAELRPDPGRPRGWTLLVNGVPQSYVDLADPGHLEFPYEVQLGAVLRLWSAQAVRETVLHLGGGGLTLPRFLDHLRPGEKQLVVERDPQILAMVEQNLPFPASIEVRLGDARTELEKIPDQSLGLIISDVFVGAAMPASVAAGGFARAARRALKPDGLLAMNLTDVPPLAQTRIQAATARTAFDEIVLYGDADVMRGRRVGNVILLAGNVPMIKAGKHEIVLRADELRIFTGGARPLLDEPR